MDFDVSCCLFFAFRIVIDPMVTQSSPTGVGKGNPFRGQNVNAGCASYLLDEFWPRGLLLKEPVDKLEYLQNRSGHETPPSGSDLIASSPSTLSTEPNALSDPGRLWVDILRGDRPSVLSVLVILINLLFPHCRSCNRLHDI